MSSLLPRLTSADSRIALVFGQDAWSYAQLAGATLSHARWLEGRGVEPGDRVAVWAQPSLRTAAAVLGNIVAGVTTIPLHPKLGKSEVEHVARDSRFTLAVCAEGYRAPQQVADVPCLSGPSSSVRGSLPELPADDSPALIVYTSGTTGPPKGAVLTRRNIAANLSALVETWAWTEHDTVVHSLPLVHVHGLVLGLLGSLRAGGALHYVPEFDPRALALALTDARHDRTLCFTVPTMVRRLAEAAELDAFVRDSLRRPRLLVSGSAGLPVREHARIRSLTGRGVHERYGLTETLINCGVPASNSPMPGYVGPALPGVELELVDDDRLPIDAHDDETIGEVAVRSQAVFAGYLNRPDATSEVLDERGWFYTGDLATRTSEGVIRILGRRSVDLIKTGGYRVGAAEIEACLLGHPSVREVAVVGVPDDDLGQRIAAFVVARPDSPHDPAALESFVAEHLSPHKRPRDVHFVEQLPRNAMGKVQKKRLGASG